MRLFYAVFSFAIALMFACLSFPAFSSAEALPPPPSDDPLLGAEFPVSPPVERSATRTTGPRIALVIGNSNYASNLEDLPNPKNDVELIGEKLGKAGFDVEIVHDADLTAMTAAVERLAARHDAAESDVTVLFYYAGHGMNVGGESFLIPVRQDFEFQEDLPEMALSMSSVVQAIGLQPDDKFIFMFDACNTDSLPGTGIEMSFRRDWWEIDAEHMFVWSASRGQEALDGEGDVSPFAETLGEVMGIPGMSLDDMQMHVRRRVAEASKGSQFAVIYSSLKDDFYFLPPVPGP